MSAPPVRWRSARWLLWGPLWMLACVGLVELGLLGLGRQLGASSPTSPVARDAWRVLAVGDSFTRGCPLSPQERFPEQLGRLLRAGGSSSTVVFNEGICELNSWQLRARLPGWLETHQPDVVLVLIGAANQYNPWGWSGRGARSSPPAAQVLRMPRAARVLGWWLGGRLVAGHRASLAWALSGTPSSLVGDYGPPSYFRGFKAWRDDLRPDSATSVTAELLRLAADEGLASGLAAAEAALALHPGDPLLLCAGVVMLGEHGATGKARAWLVRNGGGASGHPLLRGCSSWLAVLDGLDATADQRWDEVISVSLAAIPEDPDEPHHHYALTRAAGFAGPQASRDAAVALGRTAPALGGQAVATRALLMDPEEHQRRALAWLEEDLDAIAAQVDAAGATLVLQTYPRGFDAVDALIARSAARHGVPLVDHRRVFAAAEESGEAAALFVDDDHCSALGSGLMAAGVLTSLMAEGSLQRP
jgi:hypothetical protein